MLRADRVSQVVEHLPSKHEALSSSSSAEEKKERKKSKPKYMFV
jgi:hypothetical protein